jgi:hypothetical protein
MLRERCGAGWFFQSLLGSTTGEEPRSEKPGEKDRGRETGAKTAGARVRSCARRLLWLLNGAAVSRPLVNTPSFDRYFLPRL